MSSNQPYNGFLIRLGMYTAAGAAIAVALVIAIDPYGLYRIVDQPGLNQVKPQLKRYQKVIKTELALAAGADAFLIGNSRAEIGFNPEHPAFIANTQGGFNLALAGSRIVRAREQLAALRTRGVRPARLVVGVEFLDFLVDPHATPGSFAPVPAPLPDSSVATLLWRLDTAFSIDSLADALLTLRLQHASDPESMTRRGFNRLYEYRKMAREEGYYSLFQQRATDYARRFAGRTPMVRRPDGQAAPDLEHLNSILNQAAADGADVHVVIYPYHAQIMALFEHAGMLGAFEQWKVMLTAQIDAIRTAHPGARLTLWDFSGYQSYQCEPIPAKGDRSSTTRWYWEAGHFNAALGDVMLERMFGASEAAGAAGFGVKLSGARMRENQHRTAQERRACMAAAPRLFDDAARLLANAKTRR